MWQLMMSKLAPPDRTGAYIRPSSSFRNFVSTAPDNPHGPLRDGIASSWVRDALGRTALW